MILTRKLPTCKHSTPPKYEDEVKDMEAKVFGKSLTLKREVIRDLSPHERISASQGYSLWTCDMTDRLDPLTPVVNPILPEVPVAPDVREIERENEIDVEPIEREQER
jgi:hypothetical protein